MLCSEGYKNYLRLSNIERFKRYILHQCGEKYVYQTEQQPVFTNTSREKTYLIPITPTPFHSVFHIGCNVPAYAWHTHCRCIIYVIIRRTNVPLKHSYPTLTTASSKRSFQTSTSGRVFHRKIVILVWFVDSTMWSLYLPKWYTVFTDWLPIVICMDRKKQNLAEGCVKKRT